MKSGTKEYHVEGLGIVLLARHKSARRIKLSVRPDKDIRCTIPWNFTFNEAIRFIETKKEWLITASKKMEKIENRATVYRTNEIYRTNYHEISITYAEVEEIWYRIGVNKVVIGIPNFEKIESPTIQKAIRNIVVEVLRKEAKGYLPARLKELAQIHGFTYNKVFIKNNKTRWGSCSGKNNINLNLHLVRLPQEIADYVILHELAHTIHKNHGKQFWLVLNQITNNQVKKYEKELRNYNSQIF